MYYFFSIMQDLSKYSFGATSAIITSLAIIVGLDETLNPKISIIGALLVIAIADNIADSLGIHIYRESQLSKSKDDIKVYTFTNFFTRMLITAIFIFLFFFLDIKFAVLASIALGLIILSVLSYLIALNKKTSPWLHTFLHVSAAIIVLICSHFIGKLISHFFK
jgi:VIT1/CCC1 family predicted Fe2+/Mn2+ transporter